MTLNLLWSDDDASYLIVDSARSHPGTPRFSHSLLGQAQWLPEKRISVEEGVQKIIPLASCMALTLCGNEFDVLEFISAFRSGFEGFRSGMSEVMLNPLFEFITSLPQLARISVTVAVAGNDPPFTVFKYPERKLVEVLRGHIYTTGSLAAAPTEFLKGGISGFLLDNKSNLSSKQRLVGGLACTGGGGSLAFDREQCGRRVLWRLLRSDRNRFFWHPDVVYALYGPGFADGLPRSPTPDSHDGFESVEHPDQCLDLIACRVRDNVSVALSSIGKRGVAAYAKTSEEDMGEWSEKWSNELSKKRFLDAEYFVFIPKMPGLIAVIPNNGGHVVMHEKRIGLSCTLVELLSMRSANNRFALHFFE